MVVAFIELFGFIVLLTAVGIEHSTCFRFIKQKNPRNLLFCWDAGMPLSA